MNPCQWLDSLKLIECAAVETVNHEPAIRIQTANRWADGSILTFYLIEQTETILLTDDCETLFHLHTQGLDNARHIRTMREKVAITHSNINVETDGEILAIGNKTQAQLLISDYISALCAIQHWEREILGLPEEVLALADEVAQYLQAWQPHAKIQRNIPIQGISGHQYHFDIGMDNRLIWAIPPSPQAVAAIMRKAGDVLMGGDLDKREMMVIVDNRNGELFQSKAEEEIKILSSLLKAIPLTHILNKIKPQNHKAH